MDEEIKEIAEDYGLDKEEAEEIQEISDEYGLDTDDAYEIWQDL